MTISITLKNHIPGTTVYYPGDRIEETVSLSRSFLYLYPVVKVSVRLNGFSDVSKNGGKDSRLYSSISLLPATKLILHNRFRAEQEGARGPWDIEFVNTIPHYTEEYENPPTSKKWTSHMHELPPSLSLYGQNAECSGGISYYVKAKATSNRYSVKAKEGILLRRRDNISLSLQAEHRTNNMEIPPPKNATVAPETKISKLSNEFEKCPKISFKKPWI